MGGGAEAGGGEDGVADCADTEYGFCASEGWVGEGYYGEESEGGRGV